MSALALSPDAQRFARLLVLFLAVVALYTPAMAEEWPRWGGPRGDETWKAPKLRERWPTRGLTRGWKDEIGGGFGGISVAKGLLYVMDRQIQPTEVERLVCKNAGTGKTIWVHEYPIKYGQLDYGNGPRSTPTIDGDFVFTLGALGHICCVKAATGELVWQHDLQATSDAVVPTWGLAASPLIWKDLVIVHAGAKQGGCIQAFDKATGAERWRSSDDPAGYSTPILIIAPSGPLLVCWNPAHIQGFSPNDGKLLWQIPYVVTYGVSIASPIYHKDLLFITGYWEGSKAIRLGKDRGEAELVWEENKFLRGLMAQPIGRADHVYTIDKQFGLTCFEIATGKKLWDCGHKVVERGRNPHATLTWVSDEDKALLLNENGDLIFARLNPSGYHEITRTHVIDRKENSPIWAHPAYAGKQVFVRSDSEIISYELPVSAIQP